MKLTVKVKGIEELRARFKDPALIGDPLHELMEDAGHIGREAMESAIDGGIGIAVESINLNVQRTNALVFSVLPLARGLSIDQGRKPGEDPPALQIARWYMKTRRLRSMGGLTKGQRETIFEIWGRIKAKGTSGKHFLQKTKNELEDAMPRLVDEMAEKVEERWEAGRRGL